MSDAVLTEIDHVAIAVRDLDGAVAWYRDMFGATVAHREIIDRDGVEEALLKVADSYVQLLTPIRDDSTVAKYLERNGEGIHHVGYRVEDCGGRSRDHEGARRHGSSTSILGPDRGERRSPSSIRRRHSAP